MSIEDRHDIAERTFLMRDERSFRDRARADRQVGLWAATHLGLVEEAAEAYATTVMNAGVVASDGRGGFDKVAADLAGTSFHIEMIRTQYAIAMASLADHLFEGAAPHFAGLTAH